MRPVKQRAFHIAVFAIVVALAVDAQSPPPPIIDMHMHALPTDAEATGVCPGGGFPPMEAGRSWSATFDAHLKKPPCADPIWSATNPKELMDRTFAVMRRRNVYGVTGGSLTEQWAQAFPERIIPSLEFRLGARAVA